MRNKRNIMVPIVDLPCVKEKDRFSAPSHPMKEKGLSFTGLKQHRAIGDSVVGRSGEGKKENELKFHPAICELKPFMARRSFLFPRAHLIPQYPLRRQAP
jgi:hypothetical protein